MIIALRFLGEGFDLEALFKVFNWYGSLLRGYAFWSAFTRG
jgi:hypothetical protein